MAHSVDHLTSGQDLDIAFVATSSNGVTPFSISHPCLPQWRVHELGSVLEIIGRIKPHDAHVVHH